MKAIGGNISLCQVAWNFVNDSLRTSLCLNYPPDLISYASIFLATKFLHYNLYTEGKKQHWWEVLNIKLEVLEDISKQILDLYEPSQIPPGATSTTSTSANNTSTPTTTTTTNSLSATSTPSSNNGRSSPLPPPPPPPPTNDKEDSNNSNSNNNNNNNLTPSTSNRLHPKSSPAKNQRYSPYGNSPYRKEKESNTSNNH